MAPRRGGQTSGARGRGKGNKTRKTESPPKEEPPVEYEGTASQSDPQETPPRPRRGRRQGKYNVSVTKPLPTFDHDRPASDVDDDEKDDEKEGNVAKAEGADFKRPQNPTEHEKQKEEDEDDEESFSESEIEEARRKLAKFNRIQAKKQLNDSRNLDQDFQSPSKIGVGDDYIEEDSKDGTPANSSVGDNMAVDHTEFDYDSPSRDLWKEGKEEELCRLWAEEKHLYVKKHPLHRDPNKRDTTVQRFAAILNIRPNAITTRMQTLRTQFIKINKQPPSGSGRKDNTDRQEEILRLCSFLRYADASHPTVSNYKRSSEPAAEQVADQEEEEDEEEEQDEDEDQSIEPILPAKHRRHLSTPKLEKRFIYTKKAAKAAKCLDMSPIVDLTEEKDGQELPGGNRLVNLVRSDPPERKQLSKKEILRRKIMPLDDKEDEDDFDLESTPVKRKKTSHVDEEASTSSASNNKSSDGSKKTSGGRSKDEILADKKKKPATIQYPAPKKKEEKAGGSKSDEKIKFNVKYTKVDNMDWYEKQGPAYRAAQDKQKAADKKNLASSLLNKTNEMKKAVTGLSDLGKEMAQKTLTDDDCHDTKWVKTLVPHMKELAPNAKRKFMVQTFASLVEMLDE